LGKNRIQDKNNGTRTHFRFFKVGVSITIEVNSQGIKARKRFQLRNKNREWLVLCTLNTEREKQRMLIKASMIVILVRDPGIIGWVIGLFIN